MIAIAPSIWVWMKAPHHIRCVVHICTVVQVLHNIHLVVRLHRWDKIIHLVHILTISFIQIQVGFNLKMLATWRRSLTRFFDFFLQITIPHRIYMVRNHNPVYMVAVRFLILVMILVPNKVSPTFHQVPIHGWAIRGIRPRPIPIRPHQEVYITDTQTSSLDIFKCNRVTFFWPINSKISRISLM